MLITCIVMENQFIATVSNGVKRESSAVSPDIFCQHVFVLVCVMGIDMGTGWGVILREGS